jgi:L-serine dehydratase
LLLSTLKKAPSIFNDVIGPVMRGPSSSHCAAAVRIGRLARDLMGGEIRRVLVEFHPSGSLATTHETQGSDMGLFGGLLGWEATDPRLTRSRKSLAEAGIEVTIRIADYPAPHPNTYRMTLEGPSNRHAMTAISVGGGMVEVVEVDGVPLSLAGDRYEVLVFLDEDGPGDPAADPALPLHPSERRPDAAIREILEAAGADDLQEPGKAGGLLFRASSGEAFPQEVTQALLAISGVREVRFLAPVLPVLTRAGARPLFLNAGDLLAFNAREGLDLWELAVRYEAARGGISEEEVVEKMARIVEILEGGVQEGLEGAEYQDRILGPQAPGFRSADESGRLLDGGILNPVISAVTSLMEVKSAMGVIVAAPTAGACGALPGTCIGGAKAMGLGRDAMVRGMLAAGLIGVFISHRSTFAAEVCGCQAECGAGSGMAAAALVTLMDGSTDHALAAASMALQNTLGMICDPVANRVEVPCLGRNVLAAANAVACANMALAGFDPVVPLDEVIDTMDSVGKSLPYQLRCTALGGLSVTPTSKRIERELRKRKGE